MGASRRPTVEGSPRHERGHRGELIAMCARKVGAELFTYNGVDFRLIRRTWISSCACWSSEPAATEHLGSGRILSTDQRDFGAYRWKNRKPFQNLLG